MSRENSRKYLKAMRKAWIDRWKGLLILLVVFGHAVGGGGNLASGKTSYWLLELWRVIYLFHMPAFFVLAGLCWRHDSATPFITALRQLVVKRFMRLLVPYFLFGLFSWLVYDAMYGKWCDLSIQMWRMLIAQGNYTCNSVLWFLPTMFLVLAAALVMEYIFIGVQNRLSRSAKIILVAIVDYMIFFALRYSHINDLPFRLFDVLHYYFYFLLGCVAGIVATEHTKYAEMQGVPFRMFPGSIKPRTIIVGIASMAFLLLAFTVHVDTRQFGGYSLWMAQGAVGALLSAAVAITLPERTFRWLEWIGGMSMGIMLVHKFPLVAVQEHLPIVRAMFGKNLSIAFLGVVVVLVCSTICSIAATLFMKQFIPWTIGERKCTG